jgi:hypothetical protein
VPVFRRGETVTGFIGARPARVIGDIFDEHVLAQSREQRFRRGRMGDDLAG